MDLIIDDVGDRPDRCNHRHNARRHTFQQCIRETFRVTRERQYIGALPKPLFGSPKNRSDEFNSVIKVGFRDRLTQLLFRCPVPRKPEMNPSAARSQNCDGLHDVENSLAIGKAAYVNHFEL